MFEYGKFEIDDRNRPDIGDPCGTNCISPDAKTYSMHAVSCMDWQLSGQDHGLHSVPFPSPRKRLSEQYGRVRVITMMLESGTASGFRSDSAETE